MMKLPKYLLGQAAGSLSASHIIIMFDVIGVTAPGNDNTLALALLDQTPATCTKVDASLDQVCMALVIALRSSVLGSKRLLYHSFKRRSRCPRCYQRLAVAPPFRRENRTETVTLTNWIRSDCVQELLELPCDNSIIIKMAAEGYR
jgi:hypothetical protein